MNNIREGMHHVIKYVASPLHFFAVVVIILAGIIVMLAWKSTLPPDLTFKLIIVFGTLFTLIIILVIVFVVFFPKKLVFDQEAHLTMLREQLGDNELSSPYIAGTLPNVPATDVITDEKE